MPTAYHTVYARVRNQDGSNERILSNNVRGKAAETRWVRSLKRNAGLVVCDSWNLTDGRGLNAEGVRVLYPDGNS